MMTWNEDQQGLRDGFARWHAALSAEDRELDKAQAFSRRHWEIAARTGLFGLPFDELWGGLGQDLLTTLYVLESLGYGCRNGGLAFSISTHMVSCGVPLQRFGTDEQKQRFLARLCDGSAIAAHAITEPDSGSDALAMRTSARAEGGRWVLNGSKTFVSNGPVADMILVYARTNPKTGSLGITPFLVERDTPGLTIGQPIEKMGLKTSPFGELFFDECAVPAENMIGRPGGGFPILDYVMKWEILCSFVITVGAMQHRLERCIEQARSREQFGRPIGDYQAIASKIVEMRITVETARMWLYETARRFQAGENVATEIAIAKLIASEGNLRSALDAVQIFGGNGYASEFGLEKDLRDAVGGTIYSGTSEIQRARIARLMGVSG